jgi:hypothetical protein
VEDEVGEGVPPGQLLQVGEREVEDDARDDDRDHAVEPHRAEQRRRTVEPCRQERPVVAATVTFDSTVK